MVVERRDGALLTIIDQSIHGQPMPHDYMRMSEHITVVEGQSGELLRRVNSELGATLQPSGVEAFPGFSPASRVIGNQSIITPRNQPRANLIKMESGPGEFLLVTGTAKHFLFEKPTVNPCACHDWVFCQMQSQEQGAGPVFARSVEPKAFFMSREGHHCAHRLVHDRRNARCQIDAFEEFLCCRTCVLETFCWQPQELASLPCGTVSH